jgi:undecaprenyl-diphosphatase
MALPFILKDWRKGIFALALCMIGLVIVDSTTNLLKHTFERPRPCQIFEDVRLLVGCTSSFSFPSGHASNSFAVASIFGYFFRRASLPMFLIALFVGFSRIYVGVHYPSDVLAGAIWGGLIAIILLILQKYCSERFRERPYGVLLLVSLLAFTSFRYYYIALGPLDLSPDEAHYWEWSRRLDLSYYSKGPAIAYLIALTTWLMGDTVFAVRSLAPIFLALSSIFIYLLTKELFNDTKKAFVSALIIQITPLFAAYGVVMTIDSPFIFFWTVSLYLFWKAVKQGPEVKGQESEEKKLTTDNWQLYYWFLLGITIGLGLLTKYTMAFFYICAFLFIVFSKKQRTWLKTKQPYIAFLLSILIFSPVIIWNAHHEWVTLKHIIGQAHIAEGIKISFKYFFEFLGSQIGVITPLLFFLLLYGAIKAFVTRHSSLVIHYLFWFWSPVFGLFLLKSLQGKVQANWAIPAYVTAFIASIDFFLKDTIKKGTKILLSSAVIMAFVITAISHYPQVLNLPVKKDPSSRLRGWKELGTKIEEVYNSMISNGSRGMFIFSDKYQVSSELAFYIPGKPRTYCINLGRRMNQYDIWGGIEGNNRLLGLDAIFVRIGNENFPEELKSAFDSYKKERFIIWEGDKILREYIIFRCYGFKGLQQRRIKNY